MNFKPDRQKNTDF